jgi:integrase
VNFHHGGKNGEHYRLSLDKIALQRGEARPTTKADAEAWRDRLRGEIRSGHNPKIGKPGAAPSTDLTVGDVMDRFITEYVGKQLADAGKVTWNGVNVRPSTARQTDSALRIARACEVPAAHGQRIRFDQKPLASVTKADIEAIRAQRRPRGVVGCNRVLSRVRTFWNWSIREGFAVSTPFKRGTETVVKLETAAEAPRTRRLEPQERDALLTAASPHLRALIEAALSTGCRVGELLSLQWHQVRYNERGEAREIIIPPSKSKTKKPRVLPVGTRLRAVLSMRRHAPDGEPHAPDAYVFGNEVGERVKSVKKAWEITVLKSHGVTPKWVKGKPGQLTAECRDALRRIDLHFHDLRREFACTLLETPDTAMHDVQEFLGHGNITTTSRYLKSSPVRLAAVLARMEGQTGATNDGAESESEVCTPFAQPGSLPIPTASKSVN